ncbi:unnamed protein product [Auanema sp. JU1783]|nr:unnamed protein product [Auanema sp. JU1783]
MRAEEGDVPSIDKKVEENPCPFELLPREIKENILERVIDETAKFKEFKKFWRLKSVNKEFYSILNSNYAKRHFHKYPCWIRIRDHQFINEKSGRAMAVMSINCAINPKDTSSKNHKKNTVCTYHEIFFDEISEFFRAKPFRIDSILVDPLLSTDQLISTITELANQSSEKITVLFFPSCCRFHNSYRDADYSFDPYFHVDDQDFPEDLDFDTYHPNILESYHNSFRKIMTELSDVEEAGRIRILFDRHFLSNSDEE